MIKEGTLLGILAIFIMSTFKHKQLAELTRECFNLLQHPKSGSGWKTYTHKLNTQKGNENENNL